MYIFAKYVLYFLVYSLLGALSETLFRLVIDHQLYGIHGFMHLPLFPIYGFGAILIIKLLTNLRRNPILIFIFGSLIATMLEFMGSLIIEAVFKERIWDYSSMPFNLDGRVSLISSFGFGIGAIIVVYLIHPLVVKLINRLPKIPTISIATVAFVVLIIDFIYSVIDRLAS